MEFLDSLASPRGFEPPACRLGGDRSIQLSYGDIFQFLSAYFPGYLTFGSYQRGTGVLNPEKYIFANPSVFGHILP